MKKTGKFLSMILALVMAFALAVPAFAASDVEHADDYGKIIIKNPTGQRTIQSAYGETLDVYEVTVGTEQTTVFYKYFDNKAGKDSFGDVDGEKYFYVYSYEAELQDDGSFVPVDGSGVYWGPFTVEDEYFYWSAWTTPEDPAEQLYLFDIRVCREPDNTVYLAGESWFLINVKYDATQPSAPTTTTVAKPAPGVSVPLNDGSGEFLYTVKSGDSLSRIAAYYYYNDMSVYKLIYERNKDVLKDANTIYAGQVITLPSYAAVAQFRAPAQPEEKPAETEQPTVEQPAASKPAPGVSVPLNDGSGEFIYTIKSGDSLSRIAAYYYGDMNVYKLIYERNKDTLKDANTIYAGKTIILPSYAAVAEFKAAAK